MADTPGGTVLRAEDGSVYFIRDEVLAACKVEGEHLAQLEQNLAGDAEVEGFALNLSSTSTLSSTSLTSPTLSALSPTIKKDFGSIESTIMCPW